MGNFNQDRSSRDRGSRDRGGSSFGRGNDRRRDSGGRGGDFRPEMHRATCAECGASCEVPFKPSGGKPVYCSSCFSTKEGSAPRRSDDRGGSRSMFGSDRGERRMFQVVCDECGKDCEVPFKPSDDKPVYCDECFGKSSSPGRSDSKRFEPRREEPKRSASDNSINKQFEALNNRFDKLMSILAPKDKTIKLAPQDKPEAKKEEAKKEEIKKEETKVVTKKDLKKEAKKEVKKVVSAKPEKKEAKKSVKKSVAPKAKVTKKATKK